jgi:hypothetical protein
VTVIGDSEIRLTVTAKNWLQPAKDEPVGEGIAFSHLHYPGDYELSHLKPVLWMTLQEWEMPIRGSRLELEVNPLFHLFALSLLHKE